MLAGNKRVPLRPRFWEKVSKVDSNECWEWAGCKDWDGYGLIHEGGTNGSMLRAHRVSWEMENNRKIPEGMVICHHCDNPSCVNPSHLFLGTVQDNAIDAVNKGIAAMGEKHGCAKLTSNDVIQIRELAKAGRSRKDIADLFPVSRTTIDRICSGKNWKCLLSKEDS